MASTDPLPAPTAVTGTAATLLLPQSQTAARPAQKSKALELVLAGGAVVLALLIASTVIHNSDYWLHLATGRLLAHGQYHFGTDPFAYTSEGTYWVNHSWLLDGAVYLLHSVVTDTGVAVLKALLIAALALLLLDVHRPGTGLALPSACTLMALVAMSPRLLMQPVLASILLLGLSLWLLWRPHAGGPSRPLVLLLLFVLWVNVDDWFWLGPVLVGLFWLGERLGGPRRTPGWLAPAGLAVCLLNPHHLHAFRLPAEFYRLAALPWVLSIRWRSLDAVSLADCAFVGLLVLGIWSFARNRPGLRSWRLPVWLVFAVLGAWQVRAVAFFAVVSAPIAALNLQDRQAEQAMASNRQRLPRWGLLGAEVGLVALALLGWLHGFHPEGLHVGWGARPDASLERVTATLREGRFGPHGRIFNSHPDVANYGAWFCPGEKFFFHSGLTALKAQTSEFEVLRRSLNSGVSSEEAATILDRYGVTHLIVYDPVLDRLLETERRLNRGPSSWSLVRIDGQALVYRRGSVAEPAGDFQTHAERLAYLAGDSSAEFPAAPEQGPSRGPREPWDWHRLVQPPAAASWESAAASALLRAAEDEALPSRFRWGSIVLTELIGQSALPAGVATDAAVLCRVLHTDAFLGDELSPAQPLLAVRAARAALAANSDDAVAWLRLGQAYFTLRSAAGGPANERSLPPLGMLRQVQIATALENAVIAQPGLLKAHDTLALVYLEQGFLDAALAHFQAVLDITRRAGRQLNESPDAFATRITKLESQAKDLERKVQDSQNKFVSRVGEVGDNVLSKANLALRLGLARHALENVLDKAQYLQFGTEGARLELELMLRLGQAARARSLLTDPEISNNRDRLGETEIAGAPGQYRFGAHSWLLACTNAALGDYEEAGAGLIEILVQLDKEVSTRLPVLAHQLRIYLAAEIALGSHPPPLLGRIVPQEQRDYWTALFNSGDLRYRAMADLTAVAAVLELERGRPAVAESQLRTALRYAGGLYPDGRRPAPCRPLVQAWLRRIDQTRKAANDVRGAAHVP
jgi:tetratricopeptide (TPR) repeat protein